MNNELLPYRIKSLAGLVQTFNDTLAQVLAHSELDEFREFAGETDLVADIQQVNRIAATLQEHVDNYTEFRRNRGDFG